MEGMKTTRYRFSSARVVLRSPGPCQSRLTFTRFNRVSRKFGDDDQALSEVRRGITQREEGLLVPVPLGERNVEPADEHEIVDRGAVSGSGGIQVAKRGEEPVDAAGK